MKYFLIIFATAVVVFLGATVYYKGLPNFAKPQGVSVVSTEGPNVSETTSPTPESTEDLAAIIKEALVEKYGSQSAGLKVTVSKIEGEYAQGGAGGEGGGGMWFAAKLNGIWTLVWDGNGQIDCSDISPFPQFPVDMIPECWDAGTQKIIKR